MYEYSNKIVGFIYWFVSVFKSFTKDDFPDCGDPKIINVLYWDDNEASPDFYFRAYSQMLMLGFYWSIRLIGDFFLNRPYILRLFQIYLLFLSRTIAAL